MVEYFDERSTHFITRINGVPDMGLNYKCLSHLQACCTNSNRLRDVRLSEVYYTLDIPFPDNYLIDYKLKKNEPAFEFHFDEELGKIKIAIDVPDQPVLRSNEDTDEYVFVLHKED